MYKSFNYVVICFYSFFTKIYQANLFINFYGNFNEDYPVHHTGNNRFILDR